MAYHLPGQCSALRISLLASIALAALCGMSTPGWSQTVINTIQDLQNIDKNLSGDYVLGHDIDATGFNFQPIGLVYFPPGIFTGTLNGNGHVITNLHISSAYAGVGLFFEIDGLVSNLALLNVSIVGSLNREEAVGVIAGGLGLGGTITNSYATGTVEIDGDYG